MPTKTLRIVSAKVLAIRTDVVNKYASYWKVATIFRDTGSAVLLSPVDTLYERESSGAGNWDCTFDVDSNNIRSRVKGATGETVNWKGWTSWKDIDIP
jgi:hypothetical protein